MFRRLVAAAVVAALGMAVFTVSATAGSAVTKMKFDLAHEVAAGSSLSGSVSLWTRDGSTWSPLAGATVSMVVDGTEVGTLTTDASGWALISWPATVAEGSHVMKIAFDGDATSSKAQRAQGFQVTEAAPGTGTVPDAPTGLSAAPGSGFVSLTWTAPFDGGSSITGYNVYRDTAFPGPDTLLYATVPGTQTNFTDIAVVPAQTYYYYVTAVNANGEGASSGVVQVIPG